MKIAFFDCFSGMSGDMTLGSLLHVGGSEARLREVLDALYIDGWNLEIKPTEQNGIGAVDVTVTLTEEQGHGRHLHHIEEILTKSDIPQTVRTKALSVFHRLAEAEAKVHQTTVDRIHFHEVGAVDAIVDIVGSCALLEELGIDQVYCAPVPLARGFVECMHGIIPLPAPATMELLAGYPVYAVDVDGELVTPTGAALMTTLATNFGPMPKMTIQSTGYGSGKKRFVNRPNLLRVIIGEAVDSQFASEPELIAIETNLDDMSPQFMAPAIDAILAAGAVDAWTSPIQMKKGRTGFLLTALATGAASERVAEAIFEQTTTLGIRRYKVDRWTLERDWQMVETPFGPIRIKEGRFGGREMTASPEYEDVRAAAETHSVPMRIVHEAALVSYRSNPN